VQTVSSVAVETEIYRHPAVLDAAVVPVPDPKLGELVSCVLSSLLSPLPPSLTPSEHRAAIVLRPEFTDKLSSREIIDLVASALPKHCVPVLVVFQEALPRNGVGKTDKRVLKEALSKIWVGQQQRAQGGEQGQVQAKL